MEVAPPKWRGLLSGILQSGYTMGFLLAAVAARLVLPTLGWRWMFWLGALPALLALYIRSKVPESLAWEQHRAANTGEVLRAVGKHWKRFAYLIVLMTFMMFLSHGTMDLYPDFLQEVHHASAAARADIVIVAQIAAIFGAILFGHFSQKIGRRFSMMCSLGVCLAIIPLWAFGGTLTKTTLGAIILAIGVQGTWGVIPVHLNELAADAARGLMPGLTYQLGILCAAPTNSIQYKLRELFGYQWALAGFEVVTVLGLLLLLWRGAEDHGKSFVKETGELSEVNSGLEK